MASSNELEEIFYKQGFSTSYADILHLCDLENTTICLPELGFCQTGIQIADNDFCNENLTGRGTSNRTDIMYIQHFDLVTPTGNIKADSDSISERLKVYATCLKEVKPYKTIKKGEKTTQEKPISNISESFAKQWKHESICALIRMVGILNHQSKKCHLLMDSMQVLVYLLL